MTVGNYLDPLNPQWSGFAIWSGLALVQFQKNWLSNTMTDLITKRTKNWTTLQIDVCIMITCSVILPSSTYDKDFPACLYISKILKYILFPCHFYIKIHSFCDIRYCTKLHYIARMTLHSTKLHCILHYITLHYTT